MDYENHDEENEPAGKRTESPREWALVEEESDTERTDDLGEPVDEVVEWPRADVEYRSVVIIELYRT